MTGTACEIVANETTANEIYDRSDNSNLQVNRFNLLSSWLFGKISTGCTLVDISRDGCCILIPRKYSLINDSLKLVIMSPLDSRQAILVLSAQKRWQQSDYTDSQVRAGFEFAGLTHKDLRNIDTLVEHFRQNNAVPIHCNIVNG
ncbi:MAG TPA: PilZ domain-containing protein [Gammaproteobacteria bacterium]|nr:PilZ domain-containing protein [Gammaproteobacteria bacterium]